MTLAELAVSIAILAIIGGVVGAAYGVGFKALGKGNFGNSHAQDRLASAHDEMAFEQLLSQDVTRSACIWIPAGGTKYGSCTHGFGNGGLSSKCSTAMLCLGWPQWVPNPSPGSWSCEAAAYFQDASQTPTVVRRQEYSVSSTGAFSEVIGRGVTTDPVTASLSLQALTSPSGPQWVASVTAVLTGTGVSVNQPVATLVMRPIAVDPAGATAAIGGGGNPPC